MIPRKTTTIDPKWSEYDRFVAQCQLANFGTIYLDEYGCPIDDEWLDDDDVDIEDWD